MIEAAQSFFLDITHDKCPMTFVRAKLLSERMARGERAVLRLNPGEPLENLPRSLIEHGHAVISLALEDPADPSGPWRLEFEVR